MWDIKDQNTGTDSNESCQPGAVIQGINSKTDGITQIAGKQSARILIVEDQKDLSQLMSDVLQMTGAKVWVVGTGFEAYQRLAREAFDLVLLDVDLPDTSGIDICRWIRSHEQLKDLAVIFCTGNFGTDDICRKLGAGFLLKPFLMGALIEEAARAVAAKVK